jgi:anti-anti-sigma regulatory factor
VLHVTEPDWDVNVLVEGEVMVLRVRGQVDAECARRLLDVATTTAAGCRRVRIDLDGIDSLSEDAATLLLFRQAPWRQLPWMITLRAAGRPSRQAVLRAYARRWTRAVSNG